MNRFSVTTPHLFRVWLFCAALMSISSAAHAVNVISGTQLKEHCDAYTESANSAAGAHCVSYIQGFLDGAIATDAGVAENVLSELSKEELERRKIQEYRKRVRDRIIRSGPSYYAKFCVGDPVKLKDLVAKVIDYMHDFDALASTSARDVVYSALRKNYPCK